MTVGAWIWHIVSEHEATAAVRSQYVWLAHAASVCNDELSAKQQEDTLREQGQTSTGAAAAATAVAARRPPATVPVPAALPATATAPAAAAPTATPPANEPAASAAALAPAAGRRTHSSGQGRSAPRLASRHADRDLATAPRGQTAPMTPQRLGPAAGYRGPRTAESAPSAAIPTAATAMAQPGAVAAALAPSAVASIGTGPTAARLRPRRQPRSSKLSRPRPARCRQQHSPEPPRPAPRGQRQRRRPRRRPRAARLVRRWAEPANADHFAAIQPAPSRVFRGLVTMAGDQRRSCVHGPA